MTEKSARVPRAPKAAKAAEMTVGQINEQAGETQAAQPTQTGKAKKDTKPGAKKAAKAAKAPKPVVIPQLPLLGRWSTEGIEVKDFGLKPYLVVSPRLVPKSYWRFAKRQFYKSKLNIVERLLNHMYVVGHRGKKHKISSGRNTGKTARALKNIKLAFEMIEKQTGKNPVEVLLRAIENSAPLEEVISYQRGGIFVREAVVTSPQRRVDVALKHICQGTYQKSFRSKRTAAQALAEEITAAARGDVTGSYAVSERMRREKEAAESR